MRTGSKLRGGRTGLACGPGVPKAWKRNGDSKETLGDCRKREDDGLETAAEYQTWSPRVAVIEEGFLEVYKLRPEK